MLPDDDYEDAGTAQRLDVKKSAEKFSQRPVSQQSLQQVISIESSCGTSGQSLKDKEEQEAAYENTKTAAEMQ